MRIQVVSELRVRRSSATVFMPDLMVVPAAYSEEIRDRPVLAIFSDPLPLVVEVWSPSTGDYDVDAKVPVYQQRGDLEIWRIHPYERTLTAWRRQPDGIVRGDYSSRRHCHARSLVGSRDRPGELFGA